MAEEQTVETLSAALTKANAQLAALSGTETEKKAAEKKAAEAEEALAKAKAEIEAARGEAKTAKESAEKTVGETRTEAQKRVTEAELKAAAVAAGARDFKDVLALVDRNALKRDANGELENVEAVMAAMKESKPYLFGGGTSTHTETPKEPNKPGLKPANELTAEEWRAKRKELART